MKYSLITHLAFLLILSSNIVSCNSAIFSYDEPTNLKLVNAYKGERGYCNKVNPNLQSTKIDAIHKNGFDISKACIPNDEILVGARKDAIPAIDNPKFLNASDANFLKNDDRVLGVYYNGVAKAYPINIMDWHEIVNDYFSDEPIVVTYCPLCGSGLAFEAMIDNKRHTFGVSGLLYNSDVLLYDRQSSSLWSQLLNRGVVGKNITRKLKTIASSNTSWGKWKKQYPNSLVLSQETGHSRDYANGGYQGYEVNDRVWFPTAHKDSRYSTKEMILGVEINGKFKAYPFSELTKSSGVVEDNLGSEKITIKFDKDSKSGIILDNKGQEIKSVTTLFWFAWIAFHPDTDVYIYN